MTAKGGSMKRHTNNARAFTLLEIMIVIVLLSLLMAVAIPSLGALSGTRLKESASVLGGAVRDTFARTALSGKSARIVFDIDGNSWWVEEAQSVVRLKPFKVEKDREGRVVLDAADKRVENVDADTKDAKEQSKLQLLSPPAFQKVEGDFGQPQVLPSDVHFKSVWMEHLDERATKGQAALFFFPGGYAEEAHIVLTDDDRGERTITVVLQPLTGEVFLDNDEPRLPDLSEDR
jgi:general secretion pathway protein H